MFGLRDKAFQSAGRFRRRKFCSVSCANRGKIGTPFPCSFWPKVKTAAPDECWEWTGPRTHNGYGRTTLNGRDIRCHRRAYELTKGPIPAGLMIMHSCDNRLCCNPNHLRPGTAKENWDDCVSKGRAPQVQNILTELQRSQIRASTGSMAKVAAEFGVSPTTVWKLRRNANS
ncbi:HNH endonuclease [Sphingobium yanoikuyae]|uniref:HNH endonuclease n=1 Tax=Sphingobium yanoikuyae TaxID=13690 RepID=UPI0009C00A83|nr:HNH endonuclease [Sphingobium yanoikuyae]